jgi:NAD(P)-dependent dehydrogenase (short-subunit alcohol dehydrogenase family)
MLAIPQTGSRAKTMTRRTIVVTGAASGIGAAICEALTREGARVIAVDRNPVAGLKESLQADLTRPDEVTALIKALPEGLDGLANSAGLPPTAAAEAVLRVNLIGLKQLTLGLIPKLAEGASIVNLASLAGVAWPDHLPQVRRTLALQPEDDIAGFCAAEGLNRLDGRSYFLSKEALIVWTLQNRWTWRSRNITMTSVSPGPVETPILKDFVATLGARVEEDMRVMDRPGRPEDIAPVVCFLLSKAAKWLRGTNIEADGGMNRHILSQQHGL